MAQAPNVYQGRDGKTVRVWTCDVCGKLFKWDTRQGSASYGSLADEEDGNWSAITIVCSSLCWRERSHLPVDPYDDEMPTPEDRERALVRSAMRVAGRSRRASPPDRAS